MQRQHHTVERFRITPAGEAKPIFTDAYVKDLKILVEVKGSIDRNSTRMAIGQLLDYRRFIEEAAVKCAALLPEVPHQDLLQLLASADVFATRGAGKRPISFDPGSLHPPLVAPRGLTPSSASPPAANPTTPS